MRENKPIDSTPSLIRMTVSGYATAYASAYASGYASGYASAGRPARGY
jgi:hypothetical protein